MRKLVISTQKISKKRQHSTEPDTLNLTQTLRRLTVPDPVSEDLPEDVARTALLFSNKADVVKWAPRWLGQNGVATNVLDNPINALELVRSERPNAVIVDAALTTRFGQPLFAELLDAKDLELPIFVVCNSAKEISAVLETDPYDIIRKPFEWGLASRRVRKAIDAHRVAARLAEREASLGEAVAVADAARKRLRRGESIEPVTGLPNKKKFTELVRLKVPKTLYPRLRRYSER